MSAWAADAPWLAPAREQVVQAAARDRVAHAMLIHDAPGAGGGRLARWIAQLLLCTGARPRPCRSCPACAAVAEARHPDCLGLHPAPVEESKSQQIRIEQVRELAAELALASHQGGYKVAIVEPAEAMNRFAANALLKTLEEPPARTVLMLVTSQPSRLPATLRSRCLNLTIRPPDRGGSLAWLARIRGPGNWEAVLDVIGNAPMLAAELDPQRVAELAAETRTGLTDARAGRADPAGLAERWTRSDLALRLACFENWITERIRQRLEGGRQSAEMRAGTRPAGTDPVSNPLALFELLDRLREFRGLLATPVNRSLVLESLLRSLS